MPKESNRGAARPRRLLDGMEHIMYGGQVKKTQTFRSRTRQLPLQVKNDPLVARVLPQQPWPWQLHRLLDPHQGSGLADHASSTPHHPPTPWALPGQGCQVVQGEEILVDESQFETFAPICRVQQLDVPMSPCHLQSVLRLEWLARPYHAGIVVDAVGHPNRTANETSLFW